MDAKYISAVVINAIHQSTYKGVSFIGFLAAEAESMMFDCSTLLHTHNMGICSTKKATGDLPASPALVHISNAVIFEANVG